MSMSITNEDLRAAHDYLPVIMCVAEYCRTSVHNQVKCDRCDEQIVSTMGNEKNFENSLKKALAETVYSVFI